MDGKHINALEAVGIGFSYPKGTRVFDGLSFTVAQGEKVALLGRNGAGKSTLLSLLLGIEWPDEGDISVCGFKLARQTTGDIRRCAGMVFQNPDDQLFMPTVREDVAFGPRNLGMDAESSGKIADEVLERLGIAHLAGKPPYRLSGGEKRSAALATALAMQPKLLLLDEPTAFLDPAGKRTLAAILQALPIAMLIATHDMEFVRETCPRAILLSGGRALADGDTGQILSDWEAMAEAGL
jgi:cobalt/nickel transport system ATP-binding protein